MLLKTAQGGHLKPATSRTELGRPLIGSPRIAVGLLAMLAAPACATESSLSREITNTFDTVVTATTKAAKNAAAEADSALSDKKPSRLKAKPRDDAPPAKPGAQGGNKQKDDTQGTAKDAKEAAGKKPPAEPAAKEAAKPEAPGSTTDGTKEIAKKAPAIPTEWPATDVELAKARCNQLLKGVNAVTIPEPPFRKGDCGSMAPVRLISIGKSPEISFSPPPVVSCDLVVALTKWMREDVQPAAKRHLGAEVIRVESMSDYSCRMAYGRVGNKLSEHGKANALDIRGFVTAKGTEAVVLTGWGETKRDIKRQMAEAKAAAAKAEAVKTAAEEASKERAAAAEFAAKSETTKTPLPRKTLVEGIPPKKDTHPTLALPAAMVKEGTFDTTRNDFGGPKNAVAKRNGKTKKDAKAAGDTVAALPPPGDDGEIHAPKPNTPASRFLHETHAAACEIFGTTLGPEANEAHRNHFHVDMAERKVRKICD